MNSALANDLGMYFSFKRVNKCVGLWKLSILHELVGGFCSTRSAVWVLICRVMVIYLVLGCLGW